MANDFEFTIGGKPIVLDQGGVIQRWMDTYQPLRHLHQLGPIGDGRQYDRTGFHLGIGLGDSRWGAMPDIGINELYWPTGASRYAFGYFLMRPQDISAIAEAPYAKSVKLKLKAIGTLEADVYLAWRPITGLGAAEDLYLVTVVDERFWWQGRNIGDLSLSSSTEWSTVFSSVGSELQGTTIDTSDISSDYLQPDWVGLERRYESLPEYLDALAGSVNHRIVRQVDGTVRSQSYEDAADVVESNLEDTPNYIIAGNARNRPASPATIEFIFEGLINHIPCPHPFKYVYSPSGSNTVSQGNKLTVFSTCFADLTTNGEGGSPDNESWLISLGDKFGAEWLKRFDKCYDYTFLGIKPWALTAFDECVIYRCGVEASDPLSSVDRICTTRVQSLPDTQHPIYNLSQDGQLKVLTAKNYVINFNSEIAARSGSTPGSGEVTVYELNGTTLQSTGITDWKVYNWSDTAAPSGVYGKASVDEQCTAWIDNAECVEEEA